MGVTDDLFAKDPEQRDVKFCVDAELRQQLAEAQYQLEMASIRARRPGASEREIAKAGELQDRVDELVPRARERMVRFVFQALDPHEFDRLKGEHRPTPQQKRDAADEDKARPEKERHGPPQWNVDTFPPVLVAAACVRVETPSGVQDGLSVEEAERVFSSPSYNKAERAELFQAALDASSTRMRFDLPKDG